MSIDIRLNNSLNNSSVNVNTTKPTASKEAEKPTSLQQIQDEVLANFKNNMKAEQIGFSENQREALNVMAPIFRMMGLGSGQITKMYEQLKNNPESFSPEKRANLEAQFKDLEEIGQEITEDLRDENNAFLALNWKGLMAKFLVKAVDLGISAYGLDHALKEASSEDPYESAAGAMEVAEFGANIFDTITPKDSSGKPVTSSALKVASKGAIGSTGIRIYEKLEQGDVQGAAKVIMQKGGPKAFVALLEHMVENYDKFQA
jgi:hypothetical protein